MTDFNAILSSDKERYSALWISIISTGLGFLFGWAIGGEKKEKATLEWVVETSRQCEVSFRVDDYASVTDCLQGQIDQIEEERKLEAQSEGGDPRR